MRWTPELDAELERKLDPAHVKTRKQGGVNLSYIEGWHVIAELNAVFGFGDWTRETLDVTMVNQSPRPIGDNRRDGWTVTYTARVRLTVGGVVREGCGAGHGIGVDLGECHESAIKEAETDAMKRAAMTFGNRFGLALYDKARENVGRDEPQETPAQLRDRIKKALLGKQTVAAVEAMWGHGATKAAFAKLPDPMRAELTKAYSDQLARVSQAPDEDDWPQERVAS